MKSRSSQDKNSASQSVANEVGRSGKSSSPAYQINDRRAASVMQRKFRNLANGLASANIIERSQQASAPTFQAKKSTFGDKD